MWVRKKLVSGVMKGFFVGESGVCLSGRCCKGCCGRLLAVVFEENRKGCIVESVLERLLRRSVLWKVRGANQ